MRDMLNDYAESTGERIIAMDNCDPALIGLAQVGFNSVAVYDYHLLVNLLMVRDGMTDEEAIEFIDYNMRQSGEGYPVILERDQWTTALSPAKRKKIKKKSTSDQLELALQI